MGASNNKCGSCVQMSVQEFLDNPASFLAYNKRSLIQADENVSIETGVDMLADYNVLSLAITRESKPIAIVSVLDVLRYFALAVYPIDADPGDVPSLESVKKFLSKPLLVLVDLHQAAAPDSDVWLCDAQDTVADVLQAMKTVHRMVVRMGTTEEPFYRLISQTDLCREMYRYGHDLFACHFAMPITSSAHTTRERLIGVKSDTTVLEAIRVMEEHSVECVPLFSNDDVGQLVGSFSASDLRGLTLEQMHNLHCMSVSDIKMQACGLQAKPITCHSHDRLIKVLSRVLAAHVHRAWIVDSTNQVCGVLSLTDIITSILSHHKCVEK